MSKIALITDTHWGIRNDNQHVLDFQKKFLDEVFFPTLDREGIKEIIHLGDLVDKRTTINIKTHSRLRSDFLEQLARRNIKMTILLGNHDIFLKNSLRYNAVYEFTQHYPNVSIVDKPTYYTDDILLVPWICAENQDEILETIATTQAQALMGHFEIQGFEFHKGVHSTHGMDSSLFEKFSFVGSGHFHHKSDYKGIHYLGSPWETNWADYNDTKGFHLFDTFDFGLTFIKNPYKLLHKVKYDDKGKTFEDILNVDFAQFHGCYVKVIVQSKDNPFWYDTFITKIEEAGAIAVKPVDDHLNLNSVDDDDILEGTETTVDIINKNIEAANLDDAKKTLLKEVFTRLHQEAIALQN